MTGRLAAADLGLVINTADPDSVEIGRYYARRRGLQPWQILEVEVPVRAALTLEEFRVLDARIREHFGPRTQALALAWTKPWAVRCNSITAALALGHDDALCADSCAASKLSPYANSATSRPFSDYGVRPAMLLAAHSVAAAKAMIDRGVASDGRLGKRGAPPVNVFYVITPDKVRSVRAALFPPPGRIGGAIDVHVERTAAIENQQRILLYVTGLERVAKLDTLRWVPGALADHLTSTGGVLDGSSGQMSALDWIESGATASYGSVSEPCSRWQKFPHPQWLLLQYAQGITAIEAYWKSVVSPQQGVFVGEPLAAPFAR